MLPVNRPKVPNAPNKPPPPIPPDDDPPNLNQPPKKLPPKPPAKTPKVISFIKFFNLLNFITGNFWELIIWIEGRTREEK